MNIDFSQIIRRITKRVCFKDLSQVLVVGVRPPLFGRWLHGVARTMNIAVHTQWNGVELIFNVIAFFPAKKKEKY